MTTTQKQDLIKLHEEAISELNRSIEADNTALNYREQADRSSSAMKTGFKNRFAEQEEGFSLKAMHNNKAIMRQLRNFKYF
jgi:hypothetical protein